MCRPSTGGEARKVLSLSVLFLRLNSQTGKSCLKTANFLVSLPLDLRSLPKSFKLMATATLRTTGTSELQLCVYRKLRSLSSNSAWCCNPTSPGTRLKTFRVLLPQGAPQPTLLPWLLHNYTDFPNGEKGRRPKRIFLHSCLKNARKPAVAGVPAQRQKVPCSKADKGR